MSDYCPVFKPTLTEFNDFNAYIKTIEDVIFEYGIVKVIPPATWNPRHSIKCLNGPGNFNKKCVYTRDKNEAKTCKDVEYKEQYFGKKYIYSKHNNYIKKSNNNTKECLCYINDMFGDSKSISNINGCNVCGLKGNKNKTDLIENKLCYLNDFNINRNKICNNDILYGEHKKLLNTDVMVYIYNDSVWYKGRIMDIKPNIKLFKIRFNMDGHIENIYLNECIIVRDNINRNIGKRKHCDVMFGGELDTRLNSIKNIKNDDEMGYFPENIYVNNLLNINNNNDLMKRNNKYEYQSDDETLIKLKNNGIKSNKYIDNVSNLIISNPIRQIIYQNNESKVTGVYNIINVIENERMSVNYFRRFTLNELNNEIKLYKETKKIVNYIYNDKIEKHFNEIERNFLKNITYMHPLYGADTIGTLFHHEQTWNLSNLKTFLNILNNNIYGVNIPYLYFGSFRALFGWHIEDKSLFAINYLHFGYPKIWYAVPTECYEKFYNFMADLYGKEYMKCKAFIQHKSCFVSPKLLIKKGIKVYKSIQRANEIIVVAPNAYHAGFNLGFNCAESVNFATPKWFKYGVKSVSCQCGVMENTVTFNVDKIVNIIKSKYPHVSNEIESDIIEPPIKKRKINPTYITSINITNTFTITKHIINIT